MATKNTDWLYRAWRGFIYDIRGSVDHLRCPYEIGMLCGEALTVSMMTCLIINYLG